MRGNRWTIVGTLAGIGLLGAAKAVFAGSGDPDGNGFVNTVDYVPFRGCFAASGAGHPAAAPECTNPFDSDSDGDIDLVDFAAFQRAMGHLPIPLRGVAGNVLTLSSTEPYSGRQTCGVAQCHDMAQITNGSHFQQGRTDTSRQIIMRDDFRGDGRWWIRSAGMYGRWSGGSGGFNRQLAGKTNANESVMDLTTFSWAYDCGACHVGGGPAEFDRDGQRLYGYYEDTGRYQYGYERSGLTVGDVTLSGDYAFIDDADGSLSLAPWNVTGVAEPECLHCHRADRVWDNGRDMPREWRAAVLGTTTRLVDDQENPVPAFAAAGTAGQGWFSTLDTEADPPVLQISYAAGVGDGSLVEGPADTVAIPQIAMTRQPTDRACWGCHSAGGATDKRGMVWFDVRDVHFKKLTQRHDETPANDIPDERAAACRHCHMISNADHNIGKGNSPYTQFRNELDWHDLKSCRQCHLSMLPDGSPNPDKDPDAPDVPGVATVHGIGFFEGDVGPMRNLSCQACHVPYPLARGLLVTDWSLTGEAVHYYTDEFLSADPLHPAGLDKSKWYPTLRPKIDSDGVQRFFPQNAELAIYWADWDQHGTPGNRTDDTIRPITLWRLREITHGDALAGVTDDNDDGKLEINRPAEMLLYMQALKGNDRYGRPIAANPVLVKGKRVWYEDLGTPGDDVNWFNHEGSGIVVESEEVYGLDHNVLPATEAWGYGTFPAACGVCHDSVPPYESPFIDRLILVDPFDVNGNPVYTTNRGPGLEPP